MSAPATNEDLPVRIGRYDVVFPLVSDVGSSLFVGRSDDPAAGTVTIKRIAPDVTRGKDVEKFLAAVREALGVRHPNVAKIRELQNDSGEIYLVMDHLDGETAASLIHRLDVEERTLDFGLAAHVVAEAAAALDAGHELNLLHEHLTPHDIFVGYDGSVKVLDIGIARALDGLLDAKSIRDRDLPFASPERCKGDPIDRRSDVFSLGAILWELMTGVSPFERATPADTLRAILTEDPKIPPTKILRALPSDLSGIAMKALSRDPSRRYATARAFGAELRAFVRGVPMGGAPPNEPLATLMQNQFAKRIKNNARMLRRRDSSPNLKAVEPPSDPVMEAAAPAKPDRSELEKPTVQAFTPVAMAAPRPAPPAPKPIVAAKPQVPKKEVPSDLEPPKDEPIPAKATEPPPVKKVSEPPVAKPSTQSSEPAKTSIQSSEPAKKISEPPMMPAVASQPPAFDDDILEPAQERGKSKAVWGVVGAVLVIVLLVVAFFPRSSSGPIVTPHPTAKPTMTTASPTPSPSPEPTQTDPASAAASAPPTTTPTSAAAEKTTIRIETTPSKASVIVDGTSMGTSPVDLKLPRSSNSVSIEVRHTGYQVLRESITPDADHRLKLTLVPLTRAPSTAAATTPSPPTPSASAAPYHRFD